MYKIALYIQLFCFVFVGIILHSCNKFADPTNPPVEFTQVAGLPGDGRASAVAFAIDNKGYIALGKTKHDSGYLNDCWVFNPSNNSWTRKADFPGKARVKAVANTVGGSAFVGLGFAEVQVYQGHGYLTDFWKYEPLSDTWTRRADFPGTSTTAAISFVYDNEIYVGFGFNGMSFTKEMWRYSPANDKWTQLFDFKDRARSGAVVATNGSRVFFGTGYNTGNLNDWWEYFPNTNSWKKLKNMPDNGRVNGVALSVRNRFFVTTGRHFGGELTTGKLKSDILEYDPHLNVWYNRGKLPAEGRENAVCFTLNGKGYIGFGESKHSVLNDFWMFEP